MRLKNKIAFALLCCVATGIVVLAMVGCSRNSVNPLSAPNNDDASPAAMQALAKVMAVQNYHTKKLMGLEGVVGTATGLDRNGSPAVLVFVKEAKHAMAIPPALDNIATSVEVTGEIHAFKVAPGASGSVSHTAKQTAPIKLGTSGGWSKDLANGYCCGGTLGSLITNGASQYVLSNYHVFQSDIVLGGNNTIAAAGDPVIQPGLIDVNCNAASAQVVATLSSLSFPASLPNSNVDASIAQVVPGMVSPTGEILEIGTLSKSTVAAALKKTVKKSGRTSKLTRSYISGLNGTINVVYDNECAGGTAFTKTFTGQIIVSNRSQTFLRAGDSGSLLVEDVTTKPRAIGLLYAGSNTLAVANPINEVLYHFGSNFTMVGN